VIRSLGLREVDAMQRLFLVLVATAVLGACSFSDPELDKEIEKYRGTGIQQQGNVMPPHELDDIEN
jgi:hypothetical protein